MTLLSGGQSDISDGIQPHGFEIANSMDLRGASHTLTDEVYFGVGQMNFRRVLMFLIDVILAASSFYEAFLIRFDGVVPADHLARFLLTLPWLVAIRVVVSVSCRTHKMVWRYVSLRDVVLIVSCTASGTLAFAAFAVF